MSDTALINYFYRVKTPKYNGEDFAKEWEFKSFDVGYIKAHSKLEARKLIEAEYGTAMCQRSKKDDIGTKNLYLIQIYEPDPYFDKLWNQEHTCSSCGIKFTKLSRDKATDFEYIKSDACSRKCSDDLIKHKEHILGLRYDFAGKHTAVIYRIWNKVNGKSYIGKTTQAFTLRWYQHFYQSYGTKFHNAICDSSLVDWAFEIVECLGFSGADIDYKDSKGYAQLLANREQYWMEHFNADIDGFNTLKAANGEEANLFNMKDRDDTEFL